MRGIRLLMMCLTLSFWAFVVLAGELQISITPMAKAYSLGGPIAVALSLKNGKATDIEVLSAYPYGYAIQLKRTQLNGDEFPQATDLQVKNKHKFRFLMGQVRRAPTIILTPGSEFHRTMYINEYFTFNKADTYRMKWTGKHFLTAGGDWIESVCTFEIIVVPGEFTEKDLVPILEQWRGDDEQVATEVIAALSCVRQEFVCKYLVKFGRDMPGLGGEVVAALEKFADTEEGKKSLEAMGAVFPIDETTKSHGVRASKEGCWGSFIQSRVLGVFAMIESLPSEKFLREQLASPNEQRKWGVLEFLEKHGLPGKVPLDAIEPLLHDESKELAKQAQKVLDKFAKKEPAKDKEGQ